MPPLFTHIRAFLLDMDGTFYLGDHLLPGASRFIPAISSLGYDYLFLTNNSSRNAEDYQNKLDRLGISIPAEKILTSGDAAADYLKIYYPQATVAPFGTPALTHTLEQHNIPVNRQSPDCILLGFDTTFDYAKLHHLCNLVRQGVPFLATHPDVNCPIPGGYMPDIGAVLAYVQASTGRQPDAIIGKPYAPIINSISTRLQLPPASLAMVGDRLYTDIALKNHGIFTILTLTGETVLADLPASPHQPDLIVENLAYLLTILTEQNS